MYYVIQILHESQNKYFISYQVPKYILSTKNKNIIFEFGEKPDVKRKWAARDDIILLTQDKEFFQAYVTKLVQMEQSHLQQINTAKEEVARLEKEYQQTMQSELKSFKDLALKNSKIPTLI